MQALFGAQFLGLTELTKKFRELPGRLDAAEKTTVQRTGFEAIRLFKQNVSGPILRVRTGAYRNSITPVPEVKKDTEGWGAAIGVRRGPAEKYAKIHETGGVIRAKNKPFLVFKTPDGAWHSVKSVTIPARAPLRKTGEAMKERMMKIGTEEIARAIGRG